MAGKLTIGAAITVVVVAFAGVAGASHSTPPTFLDAPGVTLTVTTESTSGDVYHDRNSSGRSGTTCTAAPADDPSDNSRECWNDRGQLKGKDVTGEEGTAAGCQRIQGVSAAPVTWDGVWFNRTPPGSIPDACGDPTTGGAKGRVYTGAAVGGAGSAGAAGGGNLASGGCVQVFAEDDTPGNVVAGAYNQAQTASGSPHGGGDDDTDIGTCFDYL